MNKKVLIFEDNMSESVRIVLENAKKRRYLSVCAVKKLNSEANPNINKAIY